MLFRSLFRGEFGNPLSTVNSTDINHQALDISVFPNPNDGDFDCKISGLTSNSTSSLSVKIFDILGREIADLSNLACYNIGNNISTFRVSGQSFMSGIYILLCKNSDSTISRQIQVAKR